VGRPLVPVGARGRGHAHARARGEANSPSSFVVAGPEPLASRVIGRALGGEAIWEPGLVAAPWRLEEGGGGRWRLLLRRPRPARGVDGLDGPDSLAAVITIRSDPSGRAARW
jgi:hypothetical protein